MAQSQNGWPVIPDYSSSLLHRWVIPAKNGATRVTLRQGYAGLLLAHFALWHSETIEDITGRVYDDWGYAPRPIRGSTVISNHASGTALDLNATQHPLGVRGTLSLREKAKIRVRLLFYRGCLRHGAFYSGRVDEMHVEINKPKAICVPVARRMAKTPRGKRLLKANPSQAKYFK